MRKPINILLQTTIPSIKTIWNVTRFSLLRDHLASIKDASDNVLCKVTARNRETNSEGNDSVLSELDKTEFDELWLFAVDTGNGLTAADCHEVLRSAENASGLIEYFPAHPHEGGI